MIKSWSISRLDKYELCPRLLKYEVDKLCPKCFGGKLRGAFGETQLCDACGKEKEVPPPMARGSVIGKMLEDYVNGTAQTLPADVKHPRARAIADDMREKFKARRVKVEHSIVLSRDWKQVAEDDWDNAWLRVKLDVQYAPDDKAIHIIDWKTGGINNKTGEVRASAKYDDQLNLYAVAAMTIYPSVTATQAQLVFVDCGARFDPIIERPSGSLTRDGLEAAQKKWASRAQAVMRDRLFAPRPNDKCKYCDFSKGKGGPCQY